MAQASARPSPRALADAGWENVDPRVSPAPASCAASPQPTCGMCFKRFKTAEQLRAHVAKARHSPHDPACGSCGKHFADLDALREHLTGQLPNARCKARFDASGCARCLAVAPEGVPSPHDADAPCPFEFRDDGDAAPPSAAAPSRGSRAGSSSSSSPRRAVALDCEMVGVDPDGGGAMCARVCVVDEAGAVLLSTHVAPTRPVTDHRFDITGIRPEDLEGAPSLEDVRARVANILDRGETILVGHDLAHDLECLDLEHPPRTRRDTARYPPFERHAGKPRKLRELARDFLGVAIQAEGEAHDPREDALAAMRLYLGARDMCGAAEEGKSGGRRGGGTDKGEGGGGTGRGPPRFRCWCVDARRPRNPSLSPSLARSPSLALRDSTNAKTETR